MRCPVSSVVLAAVLVLGGRGPAFATSSVTATNTAGATNLGLDGEGSASTHIVKVADLSLSTDSSSGFTLSITSGSLTKAGGTPVPFQVALVDHNAGAPSSGAFMVASGSPYLLVTSAAGSLEKDLYIKYTPASLQDPGGYAAVIAVDIVDN